MFRMADPRLTYAKEGDFSFKDNRKILIKAEEMKTLAPCGNPGRIQWQTTYSFDLGTDPFMIDPMNHIEIRGTVRKRLRKHRNVPDQTDKWILCETEKDSKIVTWNENVGSQMIEQTRLRLALTPQSTSNYAVHGGRHLYERFVLSHGSHDDKKLYYFDENDSGNHNYIVSREFRRGSPKQVEFSKKMLDPSGFTLRVAPMDYPFQYRHRGTMTPIMFPNNGETMYLDISMLRSSKLLYTRPRYTSEETDYEYRVDIEKIYLHIKIPRMSTDGRKIIQAKSRTLGFPDTISTQYGQPISANVVEQFFSYQNMPLPNYMLFFIVNPQYFLNEGREELHDPLDNFLDINEYNIVIKFGNKELSYNVANFDFNNPLSKYMRQNLIRYNDIFGWQNVNKDYQVDMKDYQFPHYLISFNANEYTPQLLDPVDSDMPRGSKQTLSFLVTHKTSGKELQEGKLMLVPMYQNKGLLYLTQDGSFLNQDIHSLVTN